MRDGPRLFRTSIVWTKRASFLLAVLILLIIGLIIGLNWHELQWGCISETPLCLPSR
jgi:hypothetical protein